MTRLTVRKQSESFKIKPSTSICIIAHKCKFFFREGPSVSAQLERGPSMEEDGLARPAEVASILECPVCLDTMVRVRIYQCRNGHNVCERCSANPSLVSCPQCREPYR